MCNAPDTIVFQFVNSIKGFAQIYTIYKFDHNFTYCSYKERLNKLGVCLSHGRRDTILKMLGGHFSDVVVSKVKEGKV